jgi:hypothetical protein
MSGGHDHNDPVLPDSQQGGFYGQGRERNPLTLTTDSTGRAVVDSLVASQIAGQYIITASLAADATAKDTVNLTVQVPRLIPLAGGTHYEMVGAPHNYAATNDPCRPEPPTSQHSRNHFGATALITAVQNIAAAYDSLHLGVRLRINDMSLEYGGLFDNLNNWRYVPRRSHYEHRLGKNVDIAFSGISSNAGCIERLNLQHLSEIIETYTDDDTYTHWGDSPHYHIRVR